MYFVPATLKMQNGMEENKGKQFVVEEIVSVSSAHLNLSEQRGR
jgi:hypothetical protein